MGNAAWQLLDGCQQTCCEPIKNDIFYEIELVHDCEAVLGLILQQ